MARPAGYQWEPLGWDTDPVPGDPQAAYYKSRIDAGAAGIRTEHISSPDLPAEPYGVPEVCLARELQGCTEVSSRP